MEIMEYLALIFDIFCVGDTLDSSNNTLYSHQ